MKTQTLPSDITQKQICSQCFKYLSVSPICLNNKGESICGRCIGAIMPKKHYKLSLYNNIAVGFKFKCSNHLNGCNEILDFTKLAEHEPICCFNIPAQNCYFCSFSGNCLQIWNHAVKEHPDNVSLEGIISFCTKKFFIIIHEYLIFASVTITKDLFKFSMEFVAKNLPPTVFQYGLKFSKPDSNEECLCDYALLNSTCKNIYEKPLEQLLQFFNTVPTNLQCRILISTFTFEEKQLEQEKRFQKLALLEEAMHLRSLELKNKEVTLAQQQNMYESAIEIIKKMSINLFKCSNCKKYIFTELYYCPKVHCYCKDCLSSFCESCNNVTNFKRLYELEHFLVPCDWPGCNKHVKLNNFLEHKCNCLKRPYKCPLKDCNEVILSAENLTKHWHSSVPSLIVDKPVTCEKYTCTECFMLINNDLYRLIIIFNVKTIQITIEEVNVLQNRKVFKCQGFAENLWYDLIMSQVCDRFEINIKNEKYAFETPQGQPNEQDNLSYKQPQVKNIFEQSNHPLFTNSSSFSGSNQSIVQPPKLHRFMTQTKNVQYSKLRISY